MLKDFIYKPFLFLVTSFFWQLLFPPYIFLTRTHVGFFLEWDQFLFPIANPYLKIFIPTEIKKKKIIKDCEKKILTQAKFIFLFRRNKASGFSNRENERPWEFLTQSMLIAILFLTTAEYRRVPSTEKKWYKMSLNTYVFFIFLNSKIYNCSTPHPNKFHFFLLKTE